MGWKTKEEQRQYLKAYYAKNRKRLNAANRLYYKENREALIAYQRAYYSVHREKCLSRQRVWYHENLKSVREYNRARYRKARSAVLEARRLYYPVCPICSVSDFDPVIDHDHRTGKFRGLVCGPCNHLLGLFYAYPVDTLK